MSLVFFIIIFLIICIYFSKIQIRINKLKIQNIKIYIDIELQIYILRFIKIYTIKYNKNKLPTIKNNFKINLKTSFEIIKKLKIKSSNLYIKIYTNQIMLAIYIIPFLSALISNIYLRNLNKYNKKNLNYKIDFNINKQQLEIEYNGIFEVKIKDIIKTIYKNKESLKQSIKSSDLVKIKI